MLSKTFGSAVYGVDASIISVEVDIGQGTKFFMVGLPDSAVKESQQRVESAVKNLGFRMPRQKVVVNLAPADIRKEGSAYDLPIAIGILCASNQIEIHNLDEYVMSELYNTYFDRSMIRSSYQSKNTDSVYELLLALFHY